MNMKAIAATSLLMLSSAAAQDVVPVKKTDSLTKFEYDKYVASGKKTMLGFGYALNPDCSSAGSVDLKTTIQPEHGVVEVVEGKQFPFYPQENVRSKCNAERTTGMLIYYKSNDGFTGDDHFDASSLLPNGYLQEVHYNVHVR